MGSISALPTVTANFSLVLSASVSADIETHWLSQRLGSPGSLNAPMSETDTVFTLLPGSIPGGLGFVSLAPENGILIDGEAMIVTAVSSDGVTVARNVAPLAPPAAAHALGAAVYLLKYRDPWVMIADEALRPWAQQVVSALGANSATFGARISGTLALTGASGGA
jgi:hypothetical protein